MHLSSRIDFSLVAPYTFDRCAWTPSSIHVRTPRNRTSWNRLLPQTIIILSGDKWWNWMKCDKPLDGKANSNMKVPSLDAIYHICSRLWEATGEQANSRYPIVKLFVKSVQEMKVNNLDEGADAARMNDNSDEHDNDDEMPKTLLAGKDSKQLSVLLTRRCSNNLETLEVSEDRWWKLEEV